MVLADESNAPLRFSEAAGRDADCSATQKAMEEGKMRTLILIGLLIAPLPVLGQTFELGPGGFRVYPHGGGNCRELRAACSSLRAPSVLPEAARVGAVSLLGRSSAPPTTTAERPFLIVPAMKRPSPSAF
jgi:hypothetical protein